MSDRDRLIELYEKAAGEYEKTNKAQFRKSFMCDYLLANGVIVPTFNCGDRVWFIPIGLKLNEVCEATVVRVEYNYFTSPQEWVTLEYYSSIIGKHKYKSRIDLMLNKTVFLTKEEAEEKLKELKENG